MFSAALPWLFTALSITLTAVGHMLYRYYAISKKLVYLGLTVLTFIFIPVSSYFALIELSLAEVYLCASMVPILTTFGAKFFLGETIKRNHIVGLFLTTTGVIIFLSGI